MRVLFVNHTSIVSGAEMSLLELVVRLPDDVSAVIACPVGDLEEAARGMGIDTIPLCEIEASFRLHPLHTPLGALQIVRFARAVRRLARRVEADLVHANSVRAGLGATLASTAGSPPVIVHVRDSLPSTRAGERVRSFIGSRAALVLANSHYAGKSFVRDGFRARVEIVYNAIDLERFDPRRTGRAEARRTLGLDPETQVLGVVGPITPLKGQDTALQALALLRHRLPDARLLIVGKPKFLSRAARFDDAAYLRSLERMVEDLDLGRHVSFVGERRDVPTVLRALDLLLVPSWYETFGRTVVEAMAMGTPVIATNVGGPAEIVEDRKTGRLLPPREPELWAEAMAGLIREPEFRRTMTLEAYETARRFSPQAHVGGVLAAYRRVLGERSNACLSLTGVDGRGSEAIHPVPAAPGPRSLRRG